MSFLFLSLLFAFGLPTPVRADDRLIERHDIFSTEEFPVYAPLARRVDFWIDVFHRYGNRDDGTEEPVRQLLFHHAEQPELVYSVLEVKAACPLIRHRKLKGGRKVLRRIREHPAVARERLRLEKLLGQLAAGLEASPDAAPAEWSEEESRLLKRFDPPTPGKLRAAAATVRCQQGIRHLFLQALARYGAYREFIEKALEQAGLPSDIQYLPFVESSYNPLSLSPVGAAGLWQFMSHTGRVFGLRITAVADERFDPELSALAATRYFNRAYDVLRATLLELEQPTEGAQLGPLAVTSYNFGIEGVRRALRSIGAADYMKMLQEYEAKGFGTAVKNFYASFLAARHVARNAEAYFGTVAYHAPLPYDLVKLDRAMSLPRIAARYGLGPQEVGALNPSLTRAALKGQRPLPAGFPLKLPKNASVQVAAAAPPSPEETAAEGRWYKVRPGDSVIRIAAREKIDWRQLLEANELSEKQIIRVGQLLLIPSAAEAVQTAEAPPSPAAGAGSEATPASAVTTHDALAAFGLGEDLLLAEMASPAGKTYWLRVETDESLDYYAEWLGNGPAKMAEILKLNDSLGSAGARIGDPIKLPISTPEEKQEFERRRIEYHWTLEKEFDQNYRIVGEEAYTAQTGDTLESISAEQGIPLRLIRRFNPRIAPAAVAPGTEIRLPTIEARTAAP